jgi:putative hydrolase of the HAD superfamily
MSRFDLIAFDADDTLWHNEGLYHQTQAGLAELLAGYGIDEKSLDERLYRTESRNVRVFGYGIKSFTLSMIETAIDLTGGRISGREVQAILDLAKAQLQAPVVLFEQVTETVSRLAARYRLMVITKGELLDQETKLVRSELAGYFRGFEVVSDKTTESYARLFKDHALDPRHVLMVGNSLRSDILPVLELGGTAVYVPYELTWLHEAAETPAQGTSNFYQLEHLGQLPDLIEKLEEAGTVDFLVYRSSRNRK